MGLALAVLDARLSGHKLVEVFVDLDHGHVEVVDGRLHLDPGVDLLQLPLPVHLLHRVQALRFVVVPQDHLLLQESVHKN